MSKALKILITSQKGGVGKSTLSANLAAYFSYISGKKTSLVDFDHQATSGKWVKKAYPIGINCQTVDLPNAKGSGVALLKAKEALRKSVETMEVVIVDLTWTEQLTILLVAMLTSKGASGVTGAGFITLAATLSVINPALVPGMAIVFSIDKFMSEVRALTNITGNGVACVVVSRWEGELDPVKLREVMANPVAIGTEIADEKPVPVAP